MAMIHWSSSTDVLDWAELSELYRLAPLGNKPPAWLRTAFSNSMFKCFSRQDGMLVAAGRAVADGVDCSYICDVAVHPSHQGRGLGREVIERLIAASRGHRKIILYAVPGKEHFYRRLGFRRMKTAMAIFDDAALAAAKGYTEQD
jgi:ribosomal protein S18 acetylase RimI-like enzyme